MYFFERDENGDPYLIPDIAKELNMRPEAVRSWIYKVKIGKVILEYNENPNETTWVDPLK